MAYPTPQRRPGRSQLCQGMPCHGVGGDRQFVVENQSNAGKQIVQYQEAKPHDNQ